MAVLTLGSLFDGIGVFPLAAVRNGITPVWASEIEKAPVSITRRHFPDMAHLGDITKLDGGKIPPVEQVPVELQRRIDKVPPRIPQSFHIQLQSRVKHEFSLGVS